MRQKELRIALVCYGGVSLAVYMHGVTKELWHLARASRRFFADEPHAPNDAGDAVALAYQRILEQVEDKKGIRLRVLPDIVTGASAGGINAVFLAQAVHSGQSLEPLTHLWLENADVDRLLAPEAKPLSKMAKFWTKPLIDWILRRPNNAVNESVSPETQSEVRRKISLFIRGRWFEPPFSGRGFSKLLHDALAAMANGPVDAPLLPPGHPLDLMVTATDFHGHGEVLRMNSPAEITETEHRLPISFKGQAPSISGQGLAHICELTFAARATASFPGAFPALRIGEIDALAAPLRESRPWDNRDAFLQRIMPSHVAQGTVQFASLIDGSVLVNAPFASAIAAISGRPAQREVDRRIIYIDPRPDRVEASKRDIEKELGFFSAIFGSLSTIPREQPIRDNLETLEQQSKEAEKFSQIIASLRPEIESAVEHLFGRTFFLDRPNPKRLSNWREKAQQAAAQRAGYAYQAYIQVKSAGIIERIARLTISACPQFGKEDCDRLIQTLRDELERRGLDSLAGENGHGASSEAIAFLRQYDIAFRIRRLRLLARRLSREWSADETLSQTDVNQMRDAIYHALAIYSKRSNGDFLEGEFAQSAANAFEDPAALLDTLAQIWRLPEADQEAEAILSQAMETIDKPLKRRVLLTYLGFPFYDVATLPVMRNEGLTEFDPVKVDRISPEDALSIRDGGTQATLRGTEFFNFGAFFSRAYRENDYLWGRMHGAERMVDLICSTLPDSFDEVTIADFKRSLFLAICDEEEGRDLCKPELIAQLRGEIIERMG